MYNTIKNMRRKKMYSEFGINKEILELSKEVEKECVTQFQKIEEIKK